MAPAVNFTTVAVVFKIESKRDLSPSLELVLLVVLVVLILLLVLLVLVLVLVLVNMRPS